MSSRKTDSSRMGRSPSIKSCFPDTKSTEGSDYRSDLRSSAYHLKSYSCDVRDLNFSPMSSALAADHDRHGSSNLVMYDNALYSNPTPNLEHHLGGGGGASPFSVVRRSFDVQNHQPPRDKRFKGHPRHVPLYLAALKGDWRTAKSYLQWHPTAIRAYITRGLETALHIAAGARHTVFVRKLVKKMSPDDLALQNKVGNTALCFAAVSGLTEIAKVLVNKNRKLPLVRGSKGATPLYMAVLLGKRDMVWYLYSVTDDNDLSGEDRIGLLVAAITSDLFVPDANLIYYMKLSHIQALELAKRLWDQILQLDNSSVKEFIRTPTRLLFTATELGMVEFVTVLIRSYPDLIWKVDEHSRSIFHTAVVHRQEKVFSLINEIGALKDFIAIYKDEENNNMLHLAGKLPHPSRLNSDSGAALQLRREILWFKEVERIVQPLYTEMKNADGTTPHDLFSTEHKKLAREGEKWMKETASSCMVVATLITTMMFAAAFTVPGGNNQETGRPLYLKTKSFLIFAISDALALVSSATSILIFLSILTSRYAEEDFLSSLPNKLLTGLLTLFISITTMMMAFSSTLFMTLGYGYSWASVSITAVACVPVSIYALLQFRLVADIISHSYTSSIFFHPKNCLLG
ncbi:Ankyrin repeat-containing protein ITN1 [Linum grandiflorum]